MSAQIIENHLFANQFADAVRVRFHARAEFIGTLFEGLAAFAPDGRFLSANRSALFQFGRPLAVLDRQPFDALFGTAFAALVRHAEHAPGECMTLTLPSGVRVVARAECRARPVFMATGSSRGTAGKRTASAIDRAAAATARGTLSDEFADQRANPHEVRFATLDTGDAKMADVLRRVEKICGRDIPLLVLGKTGTGKEWLARAFHYESPRRAAPFVAVNCASLPDTLIEAELFGYEDGAFTGARKRGSVGKIVQANGGTLFLDEIGDMPLAQQIRLMRVLQERSVVPLGGARAIPVDVRIVCATHRNLREMIDAGTFREDLYYRINGLAVTLPALCERTDLAALVDRMLAEQQREDDRTPSLVAPEVLELFTRYRWPGNLRQLSNVLRTAGVMADGADAIRVEHLPEDFLEEHASAQRQLDEKAPVGTDGNGTLRATSASPSRTTPHPLVRMTEWQAALIEQTLARHGGNISAASRELGLARNTVYRYLRLRGAH
jgi:transcriptional regulator with PAS, ATPase and Fis domain